MCPDEFANGKSWEDYEVIPDTIGQFTGMYDMNEREIYEGDIIKWIDPYYESDTGYTINRETISCIKFDYGEFMLSTAPSYGLCDVFDMCVGEPIIIGNIHDNPELMKGETE